MGKERSEALTVVKPRKRASERVEYTPLREQGETVRDAEPHIGPESYGTRTIYLHRNDKPSREHTDRSAQSPLEDVAQSAALHEEREDHPSRLRELWEYSRHHVGKGAFAAVRAVPYFIGGALKLAAGLGRTVPDVANYLVERVDDAMKGNQRGIFVSQDTIEKLLSMHIGPVREQLQAHMRPRHHGGEEEFWIPLPYAKQIAQEVAEGAVAAYDAKQKRRRPQQDYGAMPPLALFAGIFVFFLSVFFLDAARVTGAAVVSPTGISFVGFYSLLGFSLLGITLFLFAHSERKR